MARVAEKGLRFGPLAKDYFTDRKIIKLRKRYDESFPYIYLALVFGLIYSEGYYIEWDDSIPLALSELTGYDEQTCSAAIEAMFDVDLLSREMFLGEKVLTSRGIQRQYLSTAKQCRKKTAVREHSLIAPGTDKCQPDAATEEKESVPGQVKEIKVSESSSFFSPAFFVEEKSMDEEEEKEVFGKIFFFRGFSRVDESVKEFIQWNTAPGRIAAWKKCGSRERIACANVWKEKNGRKDAAPRFEPWVGSVFCEIHNRLARDNPVLLPLLLRPGNTASAEKKTGITLTVPSDLQQYLERNIADFLRPLMTTACAALGVKKALRYRENADRNTQETEANDNLPF